MILANLTRAIREQNYYAVVLEFLIVIAGVVIGFQITAWNESRADQVRAQQYLERLVADLEENIRRTERDIEFREDVRELGLEALSYSTGARTPNSDWDVLKAYFNASQAGTSYLVRSTYNEMLAAGDLGLISDPNLRDELTVYFNEHDVAQVLDSLPEYRETVRGIIPIEMQDYIWDNCYASIGGGGQQITECGTPEAADLTSSIAVQLMMDQNLNSQLRYWVSTQRAALFIYEGRKELTQATLDALRPLREPM